MPRWIYAMLPFSVLALVLSFFSVPSLLLFVIAALGIIPLAAIIGLAVEAVAEHTGERLGGLLFATFGNATELIIGILALSKGLVDVVRASIIGSVLGNLLLVLGCAVLIGSIKHGRLRFDARHSSQYASLLVLSMAGLLLPTIADLFAQRNGQVQIIERGAVLSDFIACMLLIGYVLFILFSVFRLGYQDETPADDESNPALGARSLAAIQRLLTYRYHIVQNGHPRASGVLRQIDGVVNAIVAHEIQRHDTTDQAEHGAEKQDSEFVALVQGELQPADQSKREKHLSLWQGLLLLIIATVGVAFISEILVDAIEPMTEALNWNAAFVGLVFLPLIGGLPEYFNTIEMSLNKRMGMVLAASAGSSIQIALLMTPILVLVSIFMPVRLDLIFSLVELAVLALATFLFSEITRDGELVWLEGVLLMLLYSIMGGTVFVFGSVPA